MKPFKWPSIITHIPTSTRPWLVALLLSGFVAFYWDMTAANDSKPEPSEARESAATFIPSGYVLVPIEIANYESLDSILGNFGVVDLYLPSEDPRQRARKVGHRLRILRAPLNPSRFAVLARESESAALVAHEGPFTVVVQNPKSLGTAIDNPNLESGSPRNAGRAKSKPNTRITIEVHDDEKI